MKKSLLLSVVFISGSAWASEFLVPEANVFVPHRLASHASLTFSDQAFRLSLDGKDHVIEAANVRGLPVLDRAIVEGFSKVGYFSINMLGEDYTLTACARLLGGMMPADRERIERERAWASVGRSAGEWVGGMGGAVIGGTFAAPFFPPYGGMAGCFAGGKAGERAGGGFGAEVGGAFSYIGRLPGGGPGMAYPGGPGGLGGAGRDLFLAGMGYPGGPGGSSTMMPGYGHAPTAARGIGTHPYGAPMGRR